MKLILFDIDGTIMDSDGAGNAAFVEALTTVFDLPFSAEGFSSSGKTDTQIAIELAARVGLAQDALLDRLDEVRDHYLPGLERELSQANPTELPGVRDLVGAMSDSPDCVVGLLTGNFEQAAWLKLGSIGLTDPFETGAFGDGAPARRDLPQRAVDAAHGLTGRTFTGKDVVIIGDTPNDVACGRHLNVTSVAVATGRFDADALAVEDPDHLFDDFSAPDRVASAILG